MQFRKSISQTAECLMRSMKSRRARDFVTDQRVVEESEICSRPGIVTDQRLRIEKRGDRNEETTE